METKEWFFCKTNGDYAPKIKVCIVNLILICQFFYWKLKFRIDCLNRGNALSVIMLYIKHCMMLGAVYKDCSCAVKP